MTPLPNLKLWIKHKNHAVRLKLKPGQKIHLSEGGATEEGYRYIHSIYEYPADKIPCVTLEEHSHGSDCDGPYGSDDSYITYMWNLKFRTRNGITYPEWIHQEGSRRDYFAEKAGY